MRRKSGKGRFAYEEDYEDDYSDADRLADEVIEEASGAPPTPALSPDLVKLLHDVKEWKKNFILHLKGIVKKPKYTVKEGKPKLEWEYVQLKKPLINDKGLNTLIGIIDGFFAPELQWSKLSKEVIAKTCEDLFCDIAEAIFVNHEEWEIDLTSATLIMDEIGHAIYSFLLRAEGALLLDRITTASERREIVMPQEQRGGLFGGRFRV